MKIGSNLWRCLSCNLAQETGGEAAPAEETLETSEPADPAPEETLESSETLGAFMEAATTKTIESGATDVASDELSCDLFEYRSQTNGGLKIHMGRKHKEICQLYGDIESERDTDDWWHNNSTEFMKIFQTYKDVLEEIQESSLIEPRRDETKALATTIFTSHHGRNIEQCLIAEGTAAV